MTYATARRRKNNGDANKLYLEDRPIHAWYRFVLSFPPQLVREYLERFGIEAGQRVLDPFCGTGTTLVECKKLRLASIGVELNPLPSFASVTKTDWRPDPLGLVVHATQIAEAAQGAMERRGLSERREPSASERTRRDATLLRLPEEQRRLLLADSISPLPLHRALTLLRCLDADRDPRYAAHERLALAKTLVSTSSNLHFGPEVGVGRAKADAAVLAPWLEAVEAMASDLRQVQDRRDVPCWVHCTDARELDQAVAPSSVDAVITSPPYPNEKDYTRTTRLESVLLGFIESRAELRALKKGLVCSNTRGVYAGDPDDALVAGHTEIQHIAAEIESRRMALGKTSGFERLYARVTRLYFGGMLRHLAGLRTVLRPGARLAYVVGDQASYLRVMIRTGQLLAGLAESLGYDVEGIDLFRTRLSTGTGEQLREEVVVLRWPGPGSR